MSGDFHRVMAGLETLWAELSGDSTVDLTELDGEEVEQLIKKAGCMVGYLGNAIYNALNDGRFAIGTSEGPSDKEFAEMDAARAGEAVS